MEDSRSQKESRNNPPQTEDLSWKSQEEAQTVDSSAMEEKVSSLRDSINSLNEIVSEHIREERGKESTKSAKLQLIISSIMLSVTVVLWGVWISLQFI